MRIVFFGSASIGFSSLDALIADRRNEVAAVVTQPDRPAGRHRRPTACPLKIHALEKGIPILSPEHIGDLAADLDALNADLFVVVAYGQYIPRNILDLPAKGSINLHPSLLPKYRGASPIQWALANGDEITGVTILYVSEKMDSGDLILQRTVPICPDDTALTLEPKLAEEGARLLAQAVRQIADGTAPREPQNDADASEVRKLTKEDGRLDWTLPAETLRNRIRAFIVWPGCFCELPDGGRLKVLRAAVEERSGAPGEILDLSDPGPLIAAGKHALRLLDVQPAGKRAMPAADWLRGYPLPAGTRFWENVNRIR
jgi:methionyl-tRNA formyltransferase